MGGRVQALVWLTLHQLQLVCQLQHGGSINPLFICLGIPEGQMLIILPPEGVFSSYVTFVKIPPQEKKNNKLALNKLYKAINKQEHLHPEAVFLNAGDF